MGKKIALELKMIDRPSRHVKTADVGGGINITTGGCELSRHTSYIIALVFEKSGVFEKSTLLVQATQYFVWRLGKENSDMLDDVNG